MIEVLSSAQLSIISIGIHRFPEQCRFARNQQALARIKNVFLQTSCHSRNWWRSKDWGGQHKEWSRLKSKNLHNTHIILNKKHLPANSLWPFNPQFGGHLTFEWGHVSPSQKRSLWITWSTMSYCLLVLSQFPILEDPGFVYSDLQLFLQLKNPTSGTIVNIAKKRWTEMVVFDNFKLRTQCILFIKLYHVEQNYCHIVPYQKANEYFFGGARVGLNKTGE